MEICNLLSRSLNGGGQSAGFTSDSDQYRLGSMENQNADNGGEFIRTLVCNRCIPHLRLLVSRMWRSASPLGRDQHQFGIDLVGIDEEYRPVMRAERLRFNALTIVRQDDQFRGIMRRHHFEYQDYHVVASRLNKDTLLTDLIGAVTKI